MSSALMIGVSGLRGVIGSSLIPETAARFAGVYGGWLVEQAKGKPVDVVVGRDGRAGNAFVHHAALAGLTASGCRVIDIGVTMTPTTAVMTDHIARETGSLGLVAGMELTASHNPQMWNGLKCLVPDGRGECGSSACAPPASVAHELVARFHAGKVGLASWDRVGSVVEDDSAVEVHLARVHAALAESGVADDPGEIGRGLNVVLDSVNGSGAIGGLAALEQLGVGEILQLGDSDSGVFSHAPEPTKENLIETARAVHESQAHVGFAQDPDADRLAIIDDKGRYIGEEYTLVLSTLAALGAMKRRGESTAGATLVVNLSTSRMIDDVAARFGARVVRTAVGEANVVDAMKRERSVIGGEGNGGVIWPRVTYVRDSVAGMGLIMSLLNGGSTSLSSIVDSIPAYAIVKRKVDLARKEDAAPAVEALCKAYAAERIDTKDGIRVDFEASRAWLHVRASNTEPIMRLIAEAPSEALAVQILDDAQRRIRG